MMLFACVTHSQDSAETFPDVENTLHASLIVSAYINYIKKNALDFKYRRNTDIVDFAASHLSSQRVKIHLIFNIFIIFLESLFLGKE